MKLLLSYKACVIVQKQLCIKISIMHNSLLFTIAPKGSRLSYTQIKKFAKFPNSRYLLPPVL
jgi:hypothetical protein